MGRIRTVKPALYKHAGLYDLEVAAGFPIRTAFSGLFTVADREGRFQWKPRELKTDVLPHDLLDFEDVLNALADGCGGVDGGYIVKYRHAGKIYGFIPTFKDHQSINQREAQSVIPDPFDKKSEILTKGFDAYAYMCNEMHADGEGKVGKEEEVLREGKVGREGKANGAGTHPPQMQSAGALAQSILPQQQDEPDPIPEPTNQPQVENKNINPDIALAVVGLFNRVFSRNETLTPKLQCSISRHIAKYSDGDYEFDKLEQWADFFDYCKDSDFLTGRGKPATGYSSSFRTTLGGLLSMFKRIEAGEFHDDEQARAAG